jgi:hypothetical protein
MTATSGKGPKGAKPSAPAIFTLLVEVGRCPGDGLPEGSAGAGLLCYASGIDEQEAVRETVALIRSSGLAPLEVSALGSLAEREAAGEEIAPEERALMQRALDENAVVVAQVMPFGPEAANARG